ncbi:MAG: triphosphoribosyl-dephospho-CoA synthase [Pseudomonadota bacterium]
MPSGRSLDPRRLAVADAVRAACLDELRALKPGNVHRHADGHDMSVEQFETSAAALAEAVARPDLALGQRIFEAVCLTRQRVGCNTNLGIVLLTVPLAEAALSCEQKDLRDRLGACLAELTVSDAEWVFQAIALAAPAGLGQPERHDVHQAAKVSLLEAMAEVAERDLIARQYVTAYEDIFQIGLPALATGLARWDDRDWSTALVYLSFLAAFPDTHIARKLGQETARRVSAEAQGLHIALRAANDPETCRKDLLAFDRDLKAQGLNPGTSADLTVATLLAARLGDNNLLAVAK